MKYISTKYKHMRCKLFSMNGWGKFVEITKLPEMKISKTIGFILTIIL